LRAFSIYKINERRNKITHQLFDTGDRFAAGKMTDWKTDRKRVHRSFASGWSHALSLTSAPPRFSPVCLFFPSEPSSPPRPLAVIQPRWMPGARRRRRPLLPRGGTRQNRKCPDMSFRRGQFATWNWMIDSDNRPGAA